MMGKGSWYRPVNKKRYDKNYDRIFGKGKKMSEEQLELSCLKCEEAKRGTYKELFGDLPSLLLLPKLVCTCGGEIVVGFVVEDTCND